MWIAVAGCSSMRPPGGGGDDVASTVTAVALPQTIGGAAWVDPAAYPTIPVHVAVTGDARAVTVTLDHVDTAATRQADGSYLAMVPVAALADGDHALVATADDETATATLGVGRAGVQLTHVGTDGLANTPTVHRAGDQLFATWTDLSTGPRIAWLTELDGAGHRIGDRVALAGGAGLHDVIYARTAFTDDAIGVLYQEPGGPYHDWFVVVGLDGKPRAAPIALDPADRYGSYGGDVATDGSGFDLVWRTNDGMGNSDVRYLHVDAAGAAGSPLIVATPGAPHAGFDPIYDVTIRDAAGASLIAFKRYEHDATLDEDLARCQLATVAAGAVTRTEVARAEAYPWDDDCRIRADATGPILVWATKDLTSAADNPPDTFYATRDGSVAGAMLVSAPEARGEPAIVPTTGNAILAWTDERTYVDLQHGAIQLYAAPMSADLAVGTPIVFEHAHFIEGTASFSGAAAGTNAILTWVDERHGGGVTDPKPEIYLETIWQ